MRQVPRDSTFYSTFLIVGSGRLARHLQRYFTLEKIPYLTWERNSSTPLASFQNQASHILLAISDPAIESFILENPWLKEKTIVHFSGSFSTPLAEGAHPLMTFSDVTYDHATYLKIPFVLEKNRQSFSEILPGLKNAHYEIASDLKPLYHSLCVMSGNFTIILWEKFFNELAQTFGLPRELVYPYLQQTAANLQLGQASVLTGPLARGDQATIEKHLKILRNDPFKDVYEAFTHAFEAQQLER